MIPTVVRCQEISFLKKEPKNFHLFGFSNDYKDVIFRWQTACVGVVAALLGAVGYFAALEQLKVSVTIQEATKEQAKIAALAQQAESMFRLQESFDEDTL